MRKTDFTDRYEGEVFGFLEAVAAAPEEMGSRARSHLVFDVIRARIGVDGTVEEDGAELAIVRVMSTMNRLFDRFGVALKEGEWYRVRLGPFSDEPIAWILPAAEDYGGRVSRTNVVGIEPMATGTGVGVERRALEAYCAIGAASQSPLAPLRKYVESEDQSVHVRMVDVGQASFCALHRGLEANSTVIGYFDVGGPMFFHQKSFPSAFAEAERVPMEGFVALSHWDFDHYSLAVTRMKALRRLDWYAPDQKVGPNAAKFQKELGANLTLLAAASFPLAPALTLWRGIGSIDDRNASGYVLIHERKDVKVLLTGDVPYKCVPTPATHNLTAIAITHHGGKSGDSPPPPKKRGATAAVSFGTPNYYHHPNDDFLDAHTAVGWKIEKTRPDAYSRQDVWIL